MVQIIIVSNRLPISIKKDAGKLVYSDSLGGLATGLSTYVKDRANSLWIGWPGIASDDLSQKDKEDITKELGKNRYIPVFLSQNQIDKFYGGYSNSLIWPLFHELPLKEKNQDLINDWWQTYRSVNNLFTQTIMHYAQENTQVWVHDYQLMLLPGLLKKEHKNLHIGYFLHIPFPSTVKFARLEQSTTIIQGLLGADLIGFHTSNYSRNFIKAVYQNVNARISDEDIEFNGHKSRVSSFPMGIDYDKYASAGNLKAVRDFVKQYQKKYKRLKIIVSIDRLDPSKGLVERLKAFDLLLKENPKLIGKIIFVMIAAPSRTEIKEYGLLSKKLTALAEQINTKYGNGNYMPIDFINDSLPFEKVSALYQIANIAFVAPKKDGMNLTAKEFVASNKRRGVLILSETAGAAEELTDAIIVNPSNQPELVWALNKALKMRKKELRSRLKRMKNYLSSNTVQTWSKSFVDSLNQPIPGTPHITRSMNKRIINSLSKEFKNAEHKLLLLDYDGSLVPYKFNFTEVQPPEDLINLLKSLSKIKGCEVVLISGRTANELEKWFKKLNISLVAEHGAAIKFAGDNWINNNAASNSWQDKILPLLTRYAELTPGAKVEIKPHSLVWHYRGASVYYAQKYGVIIKRTIGPIIRKSGLELIQGNKIIEIKNPKVSKGTAALSWPLDDYDFILSIGDDKTDEELFSALPLSAYSVKIGRGLTIAKYRQTSFMDAIKLLKRLSR